MALPHILLILTDQQRTDTLGCYGGRHVATPHLDGLAASGTVFERCYVNNPICTPSRACLWTGKTVFGHGVQALHDVLPAEEKLFPAHLQAAGYTTALFGKLHVSARLVDANERHPQAGFDVFESALSPYNHDCRYHAYRDWLRERSPDFLARLQREGSNIGPIPAELHFSTWIAERVEDFVGRHTGERPFLCCASFVDPHDPFDDHPPEWLERTNLGDLARVDRQPGAADRPEGVRREEVAGALGSIDEYTDEEIVRMRRSYYASVGFLDVCVGRILEALRRTGALERTLVIFASDHGEMLGQRRLLGKGAHFYEPCARVPLLVREPAARRAGARSQALVQPHDIAATALRAAGFSDDWIRARMPAAVPLQRSTGHECVFGVYRNSCINRQKVFWDPPIHCTMVRDARYKLTVYHDLPPVLAGPGELYDLETDPAETRNLWAEPCGAAPRAALLARLESWLAEEEKAGAGGRGRRVLPPPKNWLRNNPIRLNR
jgi:arylsulfatase A-like enzyme